MSAVTQGEAHRSEEGAVNTQGGWMRVHAVIDGGAEFETEYVVWLQAGRWYADIRVPFHPAGHHRCFAGTSGWVAGRYEWTRHIDSEEIVGADVADLHRCGDRLIERGAWAVEGGTVAYQEVWSRLPGCDGQHAAWQWPEGLLVRVGAHSLSVGRAKRGDDQPAAVYRILGPNGWRPRLRVGDGADSLPSPDLSGDLMVVSAEGGSW